MSEDEPMGRTKTRSEDFLEIDRLWSRPGNVVNAFTCDVEDYFQVSAFEGIVSRDDWLKRDCRIARNIDVAMALCDETGIKGTFFTLGWVAKHYPHVVRAISDAGHEVASHGMEHHRIWRQSPQEFREDVSRSKRLLEDTTGRPVLGYRAASWSLDSRTPWAHGILAEEGFVYSSSIYPISHDHYGIPSAPTRPFYLKSSGLLEIPATTAPIMGRNLPASGGGYFRLLPYSISTWMLTRSRAQSGVPGVFYFHPWELDPHQPRIAGASNRARFRHYVNLQGFSGKLKRLMRDFAWSRMDSVFL